MDKPESDALAAGVRVAAVARAESRGVIASHPYTAIALAFLAGASTMFFVVLAVIAGAL